MDYMLVIFKLGTTLFLIGLSVYSSLYFSQVLKVEKQFGLKLPVTVKRILGGLTMVPMAVSLVVLTIVLIELVSL